MTIAACIGGVQMFAIGALGFADNEARGNRLSSIVARNAVTHSLCMIGLPRQQPGLEFDRVVASHAVGRRVQMLGILAKNEPSGNLVGAVMT